MSLDQLLQAALPTKLEDSKPVGPTLMIGLGGTGKEVLLRFRRSVVERYGLLSALPFIQYIHIDTDSTLSSREQYNLKSSDDPLFDEVKFRPTERVDLTIEGGTAKYSEHINSYPQIKRWFPTSGKLAGLGNLGDGAGQIRMASRLGLFHSPNFGKLAARLDQCKGLLKDASILKRASELGFEFDAQGMNIFTIASLAGGTGGGTFLDIGFLLQRYFPNAASAGILMLPSFFKDYAGGERVRANGYAALMELNHYSFGHSFRADWDGVSVHELAPPPFTNTYLIDGANEAGLVIGSSGKEYDAYQMIAESLFHDYSIGKFAGMKRATRINLVNFNLNVYTHNFLNEALRTSSQGNKSIVGDTYPTRFGSFGLSAITYPTDRLHSACGCRLAVSILDFWQKALLESPLDKLFTALLAHGDVSFVQGRYERRDGGGVIDRHDVEDALLWWDAAAGKTFQSYFWEKAQTIRSEIEATPAGQKAAALAEQRNLLDQFLAKEDVDNPAEWGVGIRQVESNMRLYLERLKAALERRANELADDPHLGVAYTLSLLREFKTLLRNEHFDYGQYFEAAVEQWRDSTQEYSFQLDQLQADIAKHERQLLFRSDDLRRDMDKLVGEQDSEDLGILYTYLYSRVMRQVAKRGKLICEEIDKFLGKDDPTGSGLLGRYYGLLVGFGRLQSRLRAKERYFSKIERSELVINLGKEGDVQSWYQEWMGKPDEERESLQRVGNQLLKDIFQVDGVTAALDHIQRTPVDEVESRMLVACKRFFVSKPNQPEALKLLLEEGRFPKKQREETVRHAYNLGKVWLARPDTGLEHTGLSHQARADQRPCLIGLDMSQPILVKELQEIVREIQQPGDTPPLFLSIGEMNKGTIVFYNELAGVPAFYPSSVVAPNGLRRAYDAFGDKEELHTDKNRFQFGDLIPKTTDEARRYADSLKAFVLARLLGLLKVKAIRDDADRPTFHYSYRRKEGISVDEVVLGDELHAVDFLYRDRRLDHLSDRQFLLTDIESAIHVLRTHRMLWVYGLLVEFYLKMIYPPKTDRGWIKDVTITQYSPEFAVLALAQTQIQQMVPNNEEREQLENALVAKRGKPLGEPLAFDEYVKVLEPYTKEAGETALPVTSAVGVDRVVYRPVLALDLGKIDKTYAREQPKPAPQPPPPAATKAPESQQRPCPSCGSPIDARAVFCKHCRKTVAKHVTCPTCHESQVPDDVEYCWKCGNRMREGNRIQCPQCFDFTGYESEFPCPTCGYDLKGAPEPLQDEVPTRAQPAPPFYQQPQPTPGPNNSEPGHATLGEKALLECPNCFSMVEPGPRCSVCQGLLATF